MAGSPEYFIDDRLFELPGFPLLEEGEAFQSLAWRTSAANSIGQGAAIKILAQADVTDDATGTAIRANYLLRPAQTHSAEQRKAIGAAFLSNVATSYFKMLRTDSVRAVALREQVRVSSTLICPKCIAETPTFFRLNWRVGAVFMCTKHSCLLSEVCPGCDLPHGTPRHDRGVVPIQMTQVGSLLTCMNPAPVGSRRATAKLPCGYDLRALQVPEVSHPGLLEAQQKVVHVLEASKAFEIRPGVMITPLEFFDDLTLISRLVHYAAPEAWADGLGEGIEVPWRQHCRVRDGRLVARQGKKGSSDHSMVGVPTPALMAVAVHHVVRILMAPSEEEFRKRLKGLLEHVIAREPKAVQRARKNKRISSSLELALVETTIEDGQVQAYLANHPERGASLDFRHFDDVITTAFMREHLPEVCAGTNPERFLEPFRIMLRYFINPNASDWVDVFHRDDSPSIRSMVLQLVNEASKAGVSRKLAQLVVATVRSASQYPTVGYTMLGQDGHWIRWIEGEEAYRDRKSAELHNRRPRPPQRKRKTNWAGESSRQSTGRGD